MAISLHVEVSKELSLFQVSKSRELIEIKNQLVIQLEHADMHLEEGVLVRGYSRRVY